MFVTDQNHKHPMSGLWGDPKVDIWEMVEIELYRPWFVIEFDQTTPEAEGGCIRRTMLSSRLTDVLQMTQHARLGELQLRSVALMTHAGTGSAGIWRMETLAAIWDADEPNDPGAQVKVFEFSAGGFYIDSSSGATLRDLRGLRKLAVFPVEATSL